MPRRRQNDTEPTDITNNICNVVKRFNFDHFDPDSEEYTEKIYKAKYEELLARYGKDFTPELRLAVLGRKDVDCAQVIIDATSIPLTPQQFSAEMKTLQVAAMMNTDLKPGVEKLIYHLASHNVPMAIASSTSQESFNLKVTKHQKLMNLFNHIVTAGSDPEVKRGKPHPDVFLACVSRFHDKPPPTKCLVIEDAHNGVQAARAAGMQVVMVPETFLPSEMTKDATLVLRSLEDFHPELFGLPKYGK